MSALLCSVSGRMITEGKTALQHVKTCEPCRAIIKAYQHCPKCAGNRFTSETAARYARAGGLARHGLADSRATLPQDETSAAAAQPTATPDESLQQQPTEALQT